MILVTYDESDERRLNVADEVRYFMDSSGTDPLTSEAWDKITEGTVLYGRVRRPDGHTYWIRFIALLRKEVPLFPELPKFKLFEPQSTAELVKAREYLNRLSNQQSKEEVDEMIQEATLFFNRTPEERKEMIADIKEKEDRLKEAWDAKMNRPPSFYGEYDDLSPYLEDPAVIEEQDFFLQLMFLC